MTTQGPLDGIRVIDISSMLAAPLVSQILGDFGADVIKVEHPVAGDMMRGHGPESNGVSMWWKQISRNKRPIAINLSDRRGRDVLLKLVETADVLIENFRPGTLERWDLSWETLHARNPRLILLRVTGFGQHGPYSDRAAFGTLVEAMSGFAALTGQPEAPPTLPAFGLGDSIAGIAGAAAVSMALYHRDSRGGEGQVIDLSLLEPIMLTLGVGPTMFDKLGTLQPRLGNRSDTNAPRNLYATADDKWVAVSTSSTRIAERVLQLVGHPEVIDEPWFQTAHGRGEHGDTLDSMVGDWIKVRDQATVITEFSAAGAAIAPVYDAAGVVNDPQVQAREMFIRVPDDQCGPLLQQNVLFQMSATPGSIRHTGRPLGEATDEVILGELGLSAEELDALRAAGVIA